MAQLLVRKLDEDVKERLRVRAKRNGRSVEAEAREILQATLAGDKPNKKSQPGLADEISSISKKFGITKQDTDELEQNIAELRSKWRGRDVFSKR